jgi:hypothetical protein
MLFVCLGEKDIVTKFTMDRLKLSIFHGKNSSAQRDAALDSADARVLMRRTSMGILSIASKSGNIMIPSGDTANQGRS